MPYYPGARLPGEKASKLGHLQVLNSPFVQALIKNFEERGIIEVNGDTSWQQLPHDGQPLDLIFAVDGSLQRVEEGTPTNKILTFVKTALLRLDQIAISRIDKQNPHPYALRDLMVDSAIYHSTVFPMKNVTIPGYSVYDAIRSIIFESLKDPSLNCEPLETLKWLAFEKWSGKQKSLPEFECPHCSRNTSLPYDAEQGRCSECNETIYISDMLGFHQEMVAEAARETVASAYMNIHETLLLFTGIRHFWNNNIETLKRCLFVKDGPLQIRAQYSKLVAPIRRFLDYANREGVPVCLLGQEKTGIFVDHLDLLTQHTFENQIFIPDHTYICEQIQFRPSSGAPYGKDTNYGAKVFLVLNDRYKLVLTVPVSKSMESFILTPNLNDLIGINRIIATLPSILSSRFENGLLPIELANSIASLSTYPSAQILRLFAENTIKTAH